MVSGRTKGPFTWTVRLGLARWTWRLHSKRARDRVGDKNDENFPNAKKMQKMQKIYPALGQQGSTVGHFPIIKLCWCSDTKRCLEYDDPDSKATDQQFDNAKSTHCVHSRKWRQYGHAFFLMLELSPDWLGYHWLVLVDDLDYTVSDCDSGHNFHNKLWRKKDWQ